MSRTGRALRPAAQDQRRRRLSAVGGALVPAVLATLAVVYPGAPVAQVDLNDGAVWLTNTSQLMLGRYNAAVGELNSGLVTTVADFDVLQDAGDVLLLGPGTVTVVDPASVTLAAQASVPFGAEVRMADGVVAVSDPTDGRVWASTTAMIGTLGVEQGEPDLDLGPGGRAVVARDGTVLAVGPDGALWRASVDDGGVTPAQDGALASAPVELDAVTAVGDELVALDGTTVRTASASADLSAFGADLALQQPGPAADVVLVASRTALLEVPLDGGAVREHPTGGDGDQAAPVRVGACAHGAWASAVGSYLQLCDGRRPSVVDLEGMTTTDELVFRVNREVVVLNDTLLGRLWQPLDDPLLREPNWQDIPPEEEDEDSEDGAQGEQTTQNLEAECSASSVPPVAARDVYGVRPGRTSILSVIDNDSSSDCGILAITEFDQLPVEFGTLEPVYGGRALQLTTSPTATGTVEVSYTITDGRGADAPSTAALVLTAVDPGQNAAPVQVRTGSVEVEQGASVSYDVLPDFRDPDGDHLVLVGASVDVGGTVRARQDGELSFQSDGTSLGRQTVRVVVSDGTATVEGTVAVDVRPAGSVVPVIDPVHAVTFVDQAVLVRPLDSVRSTSREPVRLAGVDELAGVSTSTDLDAGTFTFTAATVGTYYVPFVVTAGPQQATGLARIDVRARPETVPAPIAVLDVALLPPGGEVTIAPLDNDVNPAGSVLVLQSVDGDPATGLRLAPIDRSLVRISATRVLEAPTTVTYTMSNGVTSVVGQILVVPVVPTASDQPPVVPDVAVSVRAGGTVTIPVLEGASDPDGDPIRLLPTLVEPAEGLMFVSGDVLRYQAPQRATEERATFTVQDSAGNSVSASVVITVHPADAATKSPPRPVDLVARVFAGDVVRIPVPLTGIDDDGDGVLLLGQDEAPLKGRIVEVGADHLLYEALPGELGTDAFTYAVEDWVGQRAVATVRVGIVARPTTVSADVVSRNDDVLVRPGRTVEVRVLANDVDTAGGELTLDPALEAPGVDASVEGRRIVVRTVEAGVLQIGYTARNERGGSDSAVLTVTVDPDAPFLAPVARDVVVRAADTINRTTVEVDVLAVAANPSGPLSDLEVVVPDAADEVAQVTARGTVLIELTATPRTLPYLLVNTDPDAERIASYAFITVPALGDFPPVLRPGAPALRVIAGESLRIPLETYVQVAPGRTAQVVDAASVTATRSDGSSLLDDTRTLRYTPQSGYAGPASISFEVSDGPLGDATARTQVLTLPITVLAAEDYPPSFVPSVLDVGPGESVTVDLARFTQAEAGAENGTRYRYTQTSTPAAGFTVTLTGSQLTVAAAPTVRKGTVGGVTIDLAYGVAGVLPVEVDFRVVASQRPLARVVDRTITGVEGTSTSVAVLDGAFNPFPETPLTLVAAEVETPGAGDALVSGSQVTLRPAAGFIGQMVTRFLVRDATGDEDRVVEGRITTVVRGRPSTPATPRISEVRDRTVVLAWDPPASNGEPITAYEVTVQPGGQTRTCTTTTCTIDALVNDTEYTFTVAAQNAVGWSDPSPASAPARPDTAPLAPATPQVTRGDAQVTVRWDAPENPGSPIREYQVEISPAAPGGAVLSTASTALTITGLTNGTGYRVRVRAVNAAPEPGAWSASSAVVTPARVPDAPSAAQASFGSVPGSPQIDVTWGPPASDGGDPVVGYRVRVDGGEWVEVPGGGSATSYSFPASLGQEYQIAVQAFNTLGTGPSADRTGQVWTAPSAVGSLAATDAATSGTAWGDGHLRVSWTPPASTGGDGIGIDLYRLEAVGIGTWETTGTSYVVTGLLGGAAQQVQVQARNTKGEWGPMTLVSGTPTTQPSPVSFGEPVLGQPDVDGLVPVTFPWSAQTGGRPITSYRVQLRGDLGTAVDAELTQPQLVVAAQPGETLSLTVRARNQLGWGATATLDGVVVPAPPPVAGGG